MIDKPLSSGEHIKVVIFTLLFIPTIFLAGVGFVPAVFLAFGIFMMKKNEDFNHFATAIKAFKWYTVLVLLICFVVAIYWGNAMIAAHDGQYPYNLVDYQNNLVASLSVAFIPIIYFILVTKLLFKPLNDHRKWVELNGIFSSKSKSSKTSDLGPAVDIIKGETFKSYSVADELLKWTKLKDDGHISKEEYDDARKKLLNRG